MLRLWGRTTSSNVQKVMWLCAELALPYERTDAGGPFGRTQEPAYLALNPNGLVPTIEDDDFVLYFNGGHEPVQVTLPGEEFGTAWDVVIDTAADAQSEEALDAGSTMRVEARSTVVLVAHADAPARPELSAAASVSVLAEQVTESASE